MPFRLTITDDDIDQVSKQFGWTFEDDERRRALKSTKSCDIQACPGSGKTTLLVAKLAILISKWRWSGQGICVLSHTKVARHAIEGNLAVHAASSSLLRHPHFVGTIQSFVNQFLAIPYLRRKGMPFTNVDDDIFGERALALVSNYYTANAWLKHQHDPDSLVRGLRIVGPSLAFESAGRKLPSKSSKTYKQLRALKFQLMKEGLFRFDDMFAFAQA